LQAGSLLLVFLGFNGERTDIGAHVAGFAMGGVMGFSLAPTADRLKNDLYVQWVSGALTCGLFFLAWLIALHSAG
jgi:membrane associated rhomboid family serine protease